jgi:hypothetical protein
VKVKAKVKLLRKRVQATKVMTARLYERIGKGRHDSPPVDAS